MTFSVVYLISLTIMLLFAGAVIVYVRKKEHTRVGKVEGAKMAALITVMGICPIANVMCATLAFLVATYYGIAYVLLRMVGMDKQDALDRLFGG